MKSDDGFTMRQLNEGDLEQFNALLRYAFQVTTTEMVKTGWSEEEIKREKLPMLTEGYPCKKTQNGIYFFAPPRRAASGHGCRFLSWEPAASAISSTFAG